MSRPCFEKMNDCVFVLDLLSKEFMRMANSISTKFMTWTWNIFGAVFHNACFCLCEACKMNGSACVNNLSLSQQLLTVNIFQKKINYIR